MTKRKLCLIVSLLLLLFLLIFSLNFYFLSRLNEQIIAKELSKNRGKYTTIDYQIRKHVKSLKPVYLNKNPKFYLVRNKLLKNFRPANYDNVSVIWDIVHWWPNDNEIYPIFDTTMGQLQRALQTEHIKLAKNSPKGTQLKLLLQLEGKQKVIFKPKWYDRDTIIDGPVYAGKDRHTAEIFAFYLGAILNMRWTPIAMGRKINLKEIYDKADIDLKNTMFIADNQTQYCVYGKCFYCKDTEMVCGNPDGNNTIEGVILHLIPGTLSKHRSPWQRTYKDNQKAVWEENMDYCEPLKIKISAVRLLDLIDASIFDFIIQNGDRHHYETRNDRLILIDNGKGFGNPKIDYFDILAPLYQCCILRKTTWDRLLYFSGGTLSELIDQLTANDLLYPILTKDHLKAIERRLLIIYGTVELCFEKFGIDNVFK